MQSAEREKVQAKQTVSEMKLLTAIVLPNRIPPKYPASIRCPRLRSRCQTERLVFYRHQLGKQCLLLVCSNKRQVLFQGDIFQAADQSLTFHLAPIKIKSSLADILDILAQCFELRIVAMPFQNGNDGTGIFVQNGYGARMPGTIYSGHSYYKARRKQQQMDTGLN